MIQVGSACSFCKDDISLIENYDKAVADKDNVWVCHHRDGVRILPSGMRVVRTREYLIENNRYYHCPANELIFLTKEDHAIVHNTGREVTDNTRNKLSNSAHKQWLNQDKVLIGKRISEALKGKKHSKERARKSALARTGLKRTEEYKKEQSIRLKGINKGRHWKVVNGRRMWYD